MASEYLRDSVRAPVEHTQGRLEELAKELKEKKAEDRKQDPQEKLSSY